MKPWKLSVEIEEELVEWHYTNISTLTKLQTKGRYNPCRKINTDIFRMAIELVRDGKSFTPDDYEKIIMSYKDLFSEEECHASSCDHFDNSAYKNCLLNKKDECHDNAKKYYSGQWSKQYVKPK